MKIALNSDGILNNTNQNISVKTEPSSISKEGEHLQFQAPIASCGSIGNLNKRPISLDLKNTTKKQRIAVPSPLIIGSPDTQNKLLTTPDLEKILHLLPTPQPGLVYQTKAAAVTSEQEAFGKGFEEALHSLHNNSNKQIQTGNNCTISSVSSTNPTTTAIGTGMSGGSFTYTNLGNMHYFLLSFYK